MSLASTAALVLLPKCPLCVAAWVSAAGLGGFAGHATGRVLLALVGLSPLVFVLLARRRWHARALLAGWLGLCLIVGSFFLAGPAWVRWAGFALLVGAAGANALVGRTGPHRKVGHGGRRDAGPALEPS